MKTKTIMTNYQLNIQRQFELQDFQTETVILRRLPWIFVLKYQLKRLFYLSICNPSIIPILFILLKYTATNLRMRNHKYIIEPCLTLIKYAYYSVKKLRHLCPSYNFYSLLCTLQTVYQSMS